MPVCWGGEFTDILGCKIVNRFWIVLTCLANSRSRKSELVFSSNWSAKPRFWSWKGILEMDCQIVSTHGTKWSCCFEPPQCLWVVKQSWKSHSTWIESMDSMASISIEWILYSWDLLRNAYLVLADQAGFSNLNLVVGPTGDDHIQAQKTYEEMLGYSLRAVLLGKWNVSWQSKQEDSTLGLQRNPWDVFVCSLGYWQTIAYACKNGSLLPHARSSFILMFHPTKECFKIVPCPT